jgi:Fe-S-cluster containining protein
MDSGIEKKHGAAKDFALSKLIVINKEVPSAIKIKEEKLPEKITRIKGNALRKLSFLYESMEEIFSYVSKHTVCQSGCSHCCHGEIVVSDLEIEYLLKHTKAKKFKSQHNPASLDPCPFLVNDKCSIYHHRPYVCRKHVSVTDSADWCKPDLAFKYELPLLRLSGVDEAYAKINFNSGDDFKMSDIRSIFKPV